MVKKFVKEDTNLAYKAIILMSIPKHKKEAVRLVKALNLNLLNFPDLLLLVNKSAIAYYLNSSDLSILQIIHLIKNDEKMLILLLEVLLDGKNEESS